MCILFFALNAHPKYKFVYAGNRDEDYDRETEIADWRTYPEDLDGEEILAGKDGLNGGTWMGITKSGKFGALTNVRKGKLILGKESRGALIPKFMASGRSEEQFLLSLASSVDDYNQYNLLISGDISKEVCLSAFSTLDCIVESVSEGIHGLCNAKLNTSWPKIERGKRIMREILHKAEEEDHDVASLKENLFTELLADRTTFPDEELPDTGVGLEKERFLSPIFVDSAKYQYGTRCSAVIIVTQDNHVYYEEKSYVPPSSAVYEFTVGHKQTSMKKMN